MNKTLIYGSSIKGNGHFVSGCECQDSNSFSETDFSDGDIKVIAISDGHGGAPYCRSAQGARLAVDIAKRELYLFVCRVKELLDEIDSARSIIDDPPVSFISETVGSNQAKKPSSELSILEVGIRKLEKLINDELTAVKENIIRSWNEAVDEAFAAAPLQIVEAESVRVDSVTERPTVEAYVGYGEAGEGEVGLYNCDLDKNILGSLEKNHRQVYGATLLALAQYKEHVFILGIGDGDVTVIDLDDRVESPIKKNEYWVGNETDSLCQINALNNFKSLYFRRKIKIAMLSTDGIVNALEDDSALAEVALGLYESIEEDPAEFRKEFKPFLRRFSNGSADDCTICFIANGISEDAYETVKTAKEVDEETGLEATRRPMFDKYALNRELYSLCESEEKPLDLSDIRLINIGKTAINNSFMKEKYVELIEAIEHVEAMKWQHFLIREILEYGKKYLSEKAMTLKSTQEAAYRKAISELLHSDPIRLIRFKTTSVGLSKGKVKLSEKDERLGIVLEVNDGVIRLVPVTREVYKRICEDVASLVAFNGALKITDQYKLSISKYDLTLKKEN